MEKMLYLLWTSPTDATEDFCQQLLAQAPEQLLASGVQQLRISVVDEAVAAAAPLRLENNKPLPAAMVSMWVDSAIYRQRQETVLAAYAERLAGYLVTESEPIVNYRHPAEPGQRVSGMCQVALLQRPERISYQQWLDVWHNSHTQIAIDTQNTFAYRQNVVVRQLSDDAPACDAIIEENFPAAAMDSPHAFYDAVRPDGSLDDERLQANQKAMIDSVMRFIDFDKIDVMPSSEYCFK